MENFISILVTVYDERGEQLLKTAIKGSGDIFTDDIVNYYDEPENKEIILNLLPIHCRGKIVCVERIFEVEIH